MHTKDHMQNIALRLTVTPPLTCVCTSLQGYRTERVQTLSNYEPMKS